MDSVEHIERVLKATRPPPVPQQSRMDIRFGDKIAELVVDVGERQEFVFAYDREDAKTLTIMAGLEVGAEFNTPLVTLSHAEAKALLVWLRAALNEEI